MGDGYDGMETDKSQVVVGPRAGTGAGLMTGLGLDAAGGYDGVGSGDWGQGYG